MKLIRSPKDLAINGAPPAFDEPLHVGRPNIGDKQKFLEHVSAMLDRGWLTNNGPLVQQLERQIAEYLGVRNCIAMCNGTIALEIAIRKMITPRTTDIIGVHLWGRPAPVEALQTGTFDQVALPVAGHDAVIDSGRPDAMPPTLKRAGGFVDTLGAARTACAHRRGCTFPRAAEATPS